MLLVKGFTLLDADKRYNLCNYRVGKKMSQTKTQSQTHLLSECILHWEMTLWSLIYRLGDVLVYIRASRLDPVIRVCKSNHTLPCVTANKRHTFSVCYITEKWKDHLSSCKDFSHITKIESCQCMCAFLPQHWDCHEPNADASLLDTWELSHIIILLSTNHQA